MGPGAHTPEELETLLEDAFVVRDHAAIVRLFETGGVLGTPEAAHARGGDQIAHLAEALWRRDYTYLAEPRRVVQARDTALVVGRRSVNVLRRGGDRRWLYAISLLDGDSSERGRRWR